MTGTGAEHDQYDAVAGCAAGDQRALELLYARHGGACLALARQILRDPQDAEDVVQEAFLELWRDPAAPDGNRSSAGTWLVALTHARAVDRLRRGQRRTSPALGPDRGRPDERSGAGATTAVLDRDTVTALAVLTGAQREALVLAYWGGRSQREVAAMTGQPLGTVRTGMRTAVGALAVQAAAQGDRRGGPFVG